jgi:hypothetical protein
VAVTVWAVGMIPAIAIGYKLASFGVRWTDGSEYLMFDRFYLNEDEMFQRRIAFAGSSVAKWTAVWAGLTLIGAVTVFAISEARKGR